MENTVIQRIFLKFDQSQKKQIFQKKNSSDNTGSIGKCSLESELMFRNNGLLHHNVIIAAGLLS